MWSGVKSEHRDGLSELSALIIDLTVLSTCGPFESHGHTTPRPLIMAKLTFNPRRPLFARFCLQLDAQLTWQGGHPTSHVDPKLKWSDLYLENDTGV